MIVIYRACPIGSKKERPFEGSKVELVEYCFNSFKKAFRGVDYTLKVLIDKPNQDIRKIFDTCDTEESFHGDFNEGNVGTFHRQIDIALESNEPFLFVEDDYYWLPGAGEIIKKALDELDSGFLSPYDHPEHYNKEVFTTGVDIRLLGDHHFRTTDSNTLTFGGTHEALKKEEQTIKSYGWADHPMFLDVTKRFPLYVAVPSLATHMETKFISPAIDLPF